MAKVLLLSLASVLVTAQQPQFLQQSDFSQQANFRSPIPPIDPTISFNYGYEVNDIDTGDTKSHQESLENGVLTGSYSVVQPDGNLRIVEYVADEVSGFQAKVRYEPGYPVQTPPQRRPSAGGAASSQGSRFSSGSSSSSSSSRPNRLSQGGQFSGTHQGSSFTGGVSAQRPRFPAGTSQGSRFIGGPPSQTPQFQGSRSSSQSSGQSSSSRLSSSVSQNRPSGSAGVSASQGSQFRSAGFPGNPTGSSTIDASRPAGHLPQLPAGINSRRRPHSGSPGSRLSSGPSSQSTSVSSQNTFSSSSSQAGQSSSRLSGPGPLPQGISPGSRLQAGPPPSVPRQVIPGSSRPGASALRRPGAPFSSQSNAQADLAVQIAPPGHFSQHGTSSSSTSSAQSGSSVADISGSAFGAAPQAGISGASFGGASQSNFNKAAFQQNRSSSRFQSGAPSVSIQSSNAFQSRQGSGFQGGPAFDQLIKSSLLVTDENLDNIEAVELASAGFDDSSYAYRLVPVPVNN